MCHLDERFNPQCESLRWSLHYTVVALNAADGGASIKQGPSMGRTWNSLPEWRKITHCGVKVSKPFFCTGLNSKYFQPCQSYDFYHNCSTLCSMKAALDDVEMLSSNKPL